VADAMEALGQYVQQEAEIAKISVSRIVAVARIERTHHGAVFKAR
jgi:hypothetical protein